MSETSWIDEFGGIVSQERQALLQRRAEERSAALKLETARLDAQYAGQQTRAAVLKDRAKTLATAWLAAETLNAHAIPTQEWIREVPKFETKGVFKKREVWAGTRPEITLDGWQFYDFDGLKPKPGSYGMSFPFERRAMILVLRKAGNVSVVTDWDEYRIVGHEFKPFTVAGEGPRQLRALSTDPMDDHELKYTWTQREKPFDEQGEVIREGGTFGAEAAAGSYERHAEYRIEDRIRRALGALVARSLNPATYQR